jgi:hypothetical protein
MSFLNRDRDTTTDRDKAFPSTGILSQAFDTKTVHDSLSHLVANTNPRSHLRPLLVSLGI